MITACTMRSAGTQKRPLIVATDKSFLQNEILLTVKFYRLCKLFVLTAFINLRKKTITNGVHLCLCRSAKTCGKNNPAQNQNTIRKNGYYISKLDRHDGVN